MVGSALDGGSLYPGCINGNGLQVGKQFAEITAIGAYSFVVTCILLLILKYIPGLGLRVSDEVGMRDLDLDQFFDEQIGDWSYLETFEDNHQITHGISQAGLPTSSAVSVHTEPTKSERQD